MTVALGMVCQDGVLVASDSMGSTAFATAGTAKKVHTLGRSPVIWTAAGSVYTIEEVTSALSKVDAAGTETAPLKAFTTPDLDGIRNKLGSCVRDTMRTAHQNLVIPNPQAAIADFLMLGFANGTPWMLEIDQTGQLNWQTEHQFSAAGSGGAFATVAMGLMQHYYRGRELPLELGKLVAYRTIDTTIRVSSQHVGPPVQIAVCDAEGARILCDNEMDEIRLGVDRWIELERDTLARLMKGSADFETGPDAPEHDLPAMPEAEAS